MRNARLAGVLACCSSVVVGASAVLGEDAKLPPPPPPVRLESRYTPGTTLVYRVSLDARATHAPRPAPDGPVPSFFLSLDQTHEVSIERPAPGTPGADRDGTFLAGVVVSKLVVDANQGFSRARFDSSDRSQEGEETASLIEPFTRALGHPLSILVDTKAGTAAPVAPKDERAGGLVSSGLRAVEEVVARALEPIRAPALTMGSTWRLARSRPLLDDARLVTTYDCVFARPERRLGWDCARIDWKAQRGVKPGREGAKIQVERSDASGSIWFCSTQGMVVAQESHDTLRLVTSWADHTLVDEERVDSSLELLEMRTSGGEKR